MGRRWSLALTAVPVIGDFTAAEGRPRPTAGVGHPSGGNLLDPVVTSPTVTLTGRVLRRAMAGGGKKKSERNYRQSRISLSTGPFTGLSRGANVDRDPTPGDVRRLASCSQPFGPLLAGDALVKSMVGAARAPNPRGLRPPWADMMTATFQVNTNHTDNHTLST
ncbi:hypothetical protein NL676_012780 [Syzygium grande]|nr:hypothetical protein NL676_012780 [Syzygium grande]